MEPYNIFTAFICTYSVAFILLGTCGVWNAMFKDDCPTLEKNYGQDYFGKVIKVSIWETLTDSEFWPFWKRVLFFLTGIVLIILPSLLMRYWFSN